MTFPIEGLTRKGEGETVTGGEDIPLRAVIDGRGNIWDACRFVPDTKKRIRITPEWYTAATGISVDAEHTVCYCILNTRASGDGYFSAKWTYTRREF